MNYQKHYDLLINRAKNRTYTGYIEKHHIIPKCLGGSNDKTNLVNLIPEEHYVAHQLLVKIYPTNYKLIKAAKAMCASKKYNNKLYGWIRKKLSICMKGNQYGIGYKHSTLAKNRISEFQKGKILSEETKQKIRNANLGKKKKPTTEETKLKISKALSGKKHTLGHKHTNEAKKKISMFRLGKKLSNETRNKMSISKKKLYDERKKNINEST